jgi:aspartate oxidase
VVGRLAAPRPGWSVRAVVVVVVVGSGIAGLTAALRLRGLVDTVLVVTKDVRDAGSTRWAQGGIAAALSARTLASGVVLGLRHQRGVGCGGCAGGLADEMTLERAREVAETGVDLISVGALTHSVKVLDLGLDLT